MDAQQKDHFLFTALVLIFQAAAMQQMGKLKNPVTDAIERNLTAAQGSIDMIAMLKEKTTGNLTPEEERMLTEILRELRLNFVDELGKEQASAQAPKAEEGTHQ